VLVFEVHIVLLFKHFDDFIEFIHVELADEGRQVAVPKEMGQNFILQFFRVFDENLIISVPTEVVAVLSLLY
jgi:hypothetical protein